MSDILSTPGRLYMYNYILYYIIYIYIFVSNWSSELKPFTLWLLNMNGPFIWWFTAITPIFTYKNGWFSSSPGASLFDALNDLAAATVATEVEDTLAEDDLVLARRILGWDLMG